MKAVIDLVREIRPPFSPEDTVAEFCETLRRYRISAIRGDRYGAAWVREQFTKRGVDYWPSEKAKSDLYVSLLPAIDSKQVDFIEHDRLAAQLATLERRVARGGKDSIDHPTGGHDDVANAVAGVTYSILSVPEMTVATVAPIFWSRSTGEFQGTVPTWLSGEDKPLKVDLTGEMGGPLDRRPG